MLFFATIIFIFLALFAAIWARMEGRKEKKRFEEGGLSAEDFEITE